MQHQEAAQHQKNAVPLRTRRNDRQANGRARFADAATTPTTLGELIAGHRTRIGMTQLTLAARAGLSVRALRDIENDRVERPRARTVKRLAEALQLAEGEQQALTAEPRPVMSPLSVEVLGPLSVRRDGRPIALTSGMLRALFALLALQPRQAVSREQIIEVLWGEQPPKSCLRLVHVYVGRLRLLVEPAGRARGPARILRRVPGGYQLDLTAEQLDLARFDELVARARLAQEQGDLVAAQELLARALDCWRGPVAADVSDRLRQHPAAVALTRRRATAALRFADLALDREDYDEVLGRLRAVANEEPLHEGLTARLMLALAGRGEQVAALELFNEIRGKLEDQLGITPGAELADAHLRVLRHQLPGASHDTGPTPAQLPGDVAAFTGRDQHLEQLDALLPRKGVDRPYPVVIAAIAGTAGVGKTALAVHWAHLVAKRFPDGQLFVNLRGFDPSGSPVSPAEAIRGFLDALAVPPQQVPADLQAQAALYRSLLAGKRVLVVLDNARDAEQVRPLLPGAPGCMAVVTSRDRLAGLIATSGARPLILDLLSPNDARQLLAGRLGLERITAEPQATDEIIARCAGLPLALAVVAARAASRPDFPLAAVARELHDARGGLEAFHGQDQATDLRAVFSWSYHSLGAEAARLFRLLGSHPGPDITARAAASLAGVPIADARSMVDELTAAHLVNEHVPGRFTCHDLLRAYARELAVGVDSGEARTALHRILDHYLHSAYACAVLLDPRRQQLTLVPPAPGVTPEDIADERQAFVWIEAEQPVLLAMVGCAAERGFDAHAWQIAWTLTEWLDRRGHWHSLVSAERTAVAAAGRLRDRAWQAHANRILGRAHNRLDQHDDALTHLRQALDLYRELADQAGQAATHGNLAMVYERLGNHREALNHDQQALDLHRATGDLAGQAAALSGLGWGHALLGDYKQTLSFCRQALALYHELGDSYGAAGPWDSLGYAHHHLGRLSEAVDCYQQSLDLVRQAGDRYHEATALTHLGDVHAAAGDHEAARAAWQCGLNILEQLDHPDAGPVRTKLQSQQPGSLPHVTA